MQLAFIPYFLLVILINFSLFGKNKIEWQEGLITLNSGEQLKGNINYNAELDIVSFQDEESIKAFSASKVESFEIYDSELDEKRKFIAMDYTHSVSYKTKVFFELMLDGKIILLRRYKTLNQFHALKADVFTDNLGSFIYYAYSGGKFINLKNFKNRLFLTLTEEFQPELEDFVERNGLNLKQIHHQIVIIDYYNFLSDPKREVINPDCLVSSN